MAKEPTKPATRSARSPRSRQALLRREHRARTDALIDQAFRSPGTVWAILIWTVFILVCGSVAAWTRMQPLVSVGRIMNSTHLARVPFEVDDPAQTEANRRQARALTPRVYYAASNVFESLRNSLENLPKILASVENLQSAPADLTRQLELTEAGLAAIRDQASGGEVSSYWKRCSQQLVTLLARRPLLDDATYRAEFTESSARDVELRSADSRTLVQRDAVINIKEEAQLKEAMTRLAGAAGFNEPALRVVVSRLITNPEPTYQYDDAATNTARSERAAAVPPVRNRIVEGHPIFVRGKELTPAAFELYKAELRTFQQSKESAWKVWVRIASIFGAVTAIALAVAGYLTLFCPRVRRNPGRMAGIAALLAGALSIACLGTVAEPQLLSLSAIAPTVFVAVILVIAYDQRVALAIGTLHGVLSCIAMDQPIGIYALMLTGVSFAVLQLREIRERRGIIRMGLSAATALSVGTILVALIDRPIVAPGVLLRQTGVDAILAGAGGLMVGVVTLSIIPLIERLFGVTTGMTLIELRDPKQPLLRQLQQLAPGTYNHSLNVASIAEAAADSIKADALLTYVGSLYHDIGKMNKPDYFVENQSGGPNKHDKLSPAMSLLVIVGHVKDGMAMAEEFDLPRSIRHFIEAHHGTTLVEFFYNRARRQAEKGAAEAKDQGGAGAEPEMPEEIEYRYPGPKPRTKEVAILMLADAVESATRTMVEPTPSRIDALVRAMANRRLMDGQFDECDLTLRELQTITESISKSVASIYHGRVFYPSTASITQEEKRA
jgi:putative nucleotidyltransferase with HDIG domain